MGAWFGLVLRPLIAGGAPTHRIADGQPTNTVAASVAFRRLVGEHERGSSVPAPPSLVRLELLLRDVLAFDRGVHDSGDGLQEIPWGFGFTLGQTETRVRQKLGAGGSNQS